jgi:hypothetical protein
MSRTQYGVTEKRSQSSVQEQQAQNAGRGAVGSTNIYAM